MATGYAEAAYGEGVYAEGGAEATTPEVDATLAATVTLSAVSTPADQAVTLAVTVTLAATVEVQGQEARLPVYLELAATVERGDDAYTPRLIVGGRDRRGTAAAVWDPPVVAPPAALSPAAPEFAMVAAAAYGTVTMDGTRPRITGRTEVLAKRHRDRVIVDGRDITFFRGVPTPLPSYGLISPLMYGSGSLELPQVAACFETLGAGALSWLRPGAKIQVQRVDPDTGTVVATDYRGFLLDFDLSGASLRVGLAGEAAGRAALVDRQPPIFRRRNDIGFFWSSAIRSLGLRFDPPMGPDTGIKRYAFGGMRMLEYLQNLSAQGVATDGEQFTCMPRADGVYEVKPKDRTTIAGTVYLDDARTVAELRRDPAEEPNRIFATGVSPTGRRWKGGVYPVLADSRAPRFPNPDGTAIRQGDTDADTGTGGGVTALVVRLCATGYLELADRPGGYDIDVTRAVRALQDDADLNKTGNVNPATWEALFDVSVTGYSLAGSHIEPIAQRNNVRRYRRGAGGNVVGPNPAYNPRVLPIDRTIDMGAGITQGQGQTWARRELAPTAGDPGSGGGKNWVGTITFHTGALVAGTHTPGAALTSAQLLPARDLRPGMNLRLPLFDGGTTVHISGVDIAGGDGTVSVSVDTRARDTMAVWEVIARNVENRRDPARAWVRSNRSSSMTKDAVVEFEEFGGIISDTDLRAGWNVVPVVVGMEGTIARLRLRLRLPDEFVTAVYGRKTNRRRLAQVVGNPLTEAGTNRWNSANDGPLAGSVPLYVAGAFDAPCGYYPGKKPASGTAVLTGRWVDDAGFGYRTFESSCVVWLAVYVPTANGLQAGRVMWPQLEAGS